MCVVAEMRDGELKYLKGRKYLDAWCVYFWATTPVLISILTFGTYVLMGNKLTAATVFTSMALMNMLISPLNAFPWVLNGLTEAWVSLSRIQRFLDVSFIDAIHAYSYWFWYIRKYKSFGSSTGTEKKTSNADEMQYRLVFVFWN